MTPAAIIKQASVAGVSLTLTPAGTIKATGDGAAVNRWIPVIREHKPGILAALQEAAYDTLPDAVAETRRRRVLAVLAENPEARYAVLTDTQADPEAVLLTLAIRGRATCELRIPRDSYDPFLLLDLIERHGGTLH